MSSIRKCRTFYVVEWHEGFESGVCSKTIAKPKWETVFRAFATEEEAKQQAAVYTAGLYEGEDVEYRVRKIIIDTPDEMPVPREEPEAPVQAREPQAEEF